MTKSKLYETLVLAVDLEQQGEALASRAGQIAAQLECTVIQAVHVVEPLPPPVVTGAVEPAPVVTNAEVEEERLDNAHRRLERLAKLAKLDPAKVQVRSGSVTDEILLAADAINAELIVVGTHGRSGLGRLLGSNASAIVHRASCDVLTLHLDDQND